MAYVQKLVTADSFDARGVLVQSGHIGVFDTDRINGSEEHLKDVGDFTPARVEISAIAPTGPNPQNPQQLPAGAVQGPGGQYIEPGKILVGEVTNPVDQRIDAVGLRDPDAEAAITDIMSNATSGAPAASIVDAKAADVTADLGTRTDAELQDILTAEQAGKNRVTVVNAVQAEIDARKQQPPAA